MSKSLFYSAIVFLLWGCSPVVETSQKFAEGGEFSIENSIEYLDKIIKHNSSNSDALFQRASLELKIARTLRAKEDIMEALEEEPKNPDYLILKAKIDNQLGQFQEAITTIELLLENNIPISTVEDQLFVAELYLKYGNESKSNYFLQKAAASAPSFPDVIFQRARFYAITHDTVKAINYYKLLLAKDSIHENGIIGLADIFIQTSKSDSALAWLDNLQKSKNHVYSCLIARALKQKNQVDSASSWWGKALLITPRLAEAHYELADYYYHKGNYPSAKSHLASVPENEHNRYKGYNLLYAKTCTMLQDSATAAIYYHKVYLQDSTLLRPKKKHHHTEKQSVTPNDSTK